MQKELHRLPKQLYQVAQVTLLFILAYALYQQHPFKTQREWLQDGSRAQNGAPSGSEDIPEGPTVWSSLCCAFSPNALCPLFTAHALKLCKIIFLKIHQRLI